MSKKRSHRAPTFVEQSTLTIEMAYTIEFWNLLFFFVE